VHGDLRVVSTGLNAEIAIRALRVELLGRKVGQSLQCIGLPASKPKTSFAVLPEERRTKPKGDG
jgi:hypothetical protein